MSEKGWVGISGMGWVDARTKTTRRYHHSWHGQMAGSVR